MKKMILLLMLFVGLISYTMAQNPQWKLYASGIRTQALVEGDNKWIGTTGGLASFDGTTWTIYNTANSYLPDNTVNTVTIDEFGSKWLGTFTGGIAVFNENGIPVRITEIQVKPGDVNIFPNPAMDFFFIEPLSTMQIYLIELVDLKGKVIYRRSISNLQSTIDISGLSCGVYIVKVLTDKGLEAHKLIKK